MKKFFSLLTALTLVVSMLSAFTAVAAVNTTVFYNAATDEQITSLDNVDSIYPATSFTGRYYDTASVIVTHYNADGKLIKVESITPVESTVGATVTHTTEDISVTDTDIIKIFAWTGTDTLKPLLQFPGIISRSIPLPTATVTELDVAEITTVPLTFAMNFKADESTEAQLLAYGNWYADFELKINKEATFNLDGTKDGYLAGQYDSWSPAWVTVPKMDITLAADTPLKIMETAAETYGEPGLKYTYQEVYDRVKDFDCGVFFTDAFLAANPDLLVSLELRMYNPLDETESYVIGETYTFKQNINMTTESIVLTAENVTAEVPAGVILEEGVTELVLSLTDLDASQSGVSVGDNEEMDAKDIHIEGVSDKNTTPIIITMTEAAPTGLNKGNLTLYHVENGVAVEMTEVETKEDLVAHNQFTYDPATGTIVMAMATFSEVTLVSDTENVWNGVIATAFSGGTGTEDDPYIIANADQLAYMNELISNENEAYGEKAYKLISDLNFTGSTTVFYPIGYRKLGEGANSAGETTWYTYGGAFSGIFDGNGNTISGIYQNTWSMDGNYDNGYYKEAMGLFGYVYNSTVKNLTVENFSSDGEFTPTGVIAAYAAGNSTFENISVFNCNPRVYNTGNGGIVGIVGDTESNNTPDNTVTFNNITVDQSNKISALWGSWDVACGGIMGMFRGYSNVELNNCHVAAQIDVNNDVCANYQYYWYRYSGMFIGSVRRNTTENGYTVAHTDNITATDCTYTLGDWNEYWYCELVANSLASYTHDHQFSRLEKIADVSAIRDENGNWTKAGNFVIPNADNSSAICYHIMKDAEGNLYQHKHEDSGYETTDVDGDGVVDSDLLKEDRTCYFMPFNQLFNGNGYGVKPTYTADEYSQIDITLVEDGDVKSVYKFAAKNTTTDTTTIETTLAEGAEEASATVNVGDLFTAIAAESKIAKVSLHVYVSPVGDDSTVSGTFAGNTGDWAAGTVTFTGEGAAKVTITDYFYCTPTTIYVTVGQATAEETPVDKFTANTVEEKQLVYGANGLKAVSVTLGELFTAADGATIDDANITVTPAETYTPGATWAEGTVTFSAAGTYTVTITDGDLCIPASATVTVADADSVNKFVGKTVTYKHQLATVESETLTFDFAELFDANDVYAIKEITVTGGTYAGGKVTVTNSVGEEITVTATDNEYCNTATATITIEAPDNIDKWKGNTLTIELDADKNPKTLTFTELFTEIDVTSSKTPIVTVDPANATVNSDKSVTFNASGSYTVTVTDGFYCNDATATVTVKEDKFALVFPNTDTYLYRVGNQNTVSVGNLFKLADNITDEQIGTVSVDVKTITGATGTHSPASNWTDGTIQFTGTGVVEVTITETYAKPVSLKLEVVDATNVTTANFSENTVLLNDVSTSNTLSASGIVYGNGFTVDMSGAPISEKNGAVFHLYDGAVLKNLGIKGAEFTSVAMNVNDTNYGVSTVRAWGTVTIENCYISGCRAAVSVTGTELTIKDSVIANGVYANIDFRSGTLNLHNVTTINEPHSVDGTTIVGLGIVGNMTASAGRNINITGTLTQYNWVSQADCENIKASGVDSIFQSVFTEDQYSALRYTYNGTKYVNTGILSLCSDFGSAAVTGTPIEYVGQSVTGTAFGTSIDGYVWSYGEAGTLTDEDMQYHDTVYEWKASNQGTSVMAPGFAYDSAGLTAEDGVVQISYESGSSYTLSNETLKTLFAATKYGQDLSYTISMNGVDYTDKDIVFDAAVSQTYTITYTITDNLVYDQNGNLTNTTYEVSKELKVFATVVDKGADAPTFTFYYGTNGSASAGTPHTTQPTNSYTSTIVPVGESYYIMPNVSATSANAIGSQTVGDTTVYYPIVDGINVRSGNPTDYDFTRYYPIFKAVAISDNGTEYSYSATTEMPATVSWEEETIDSGNGASALNTGFGLYNDQYLCKIQTKAGNAEAGGTSVVKYKYTALDGNTYYYYVGYRFYDEDESSCFTPDTLITMADGTQKQVQDITFGEQILAWDFFTGEYVAKDIALLVNHGEDLYTVANLNFSDGTTLRLIADHGVFDYDLNEFVYLTADNYEEYIGHQFVKQNLDGGYDMVTLDSGFVTEEVTSAYSITSAGTSNAFAEGMLTVAPPGDFYNWIQMGDKVRYDAEAFQKDVETYGLYTYDVFQDYVTYEQFVDWNGAYLKIPVEKGLFTFDYILGLIDLYGSYMPQ